MGKLIETEWKGSYEGPGSRENGKRLAKGYKVSISPGLTLSLLHLCSNYLLSED